MFHLFISNQTGDEVTVEADGFDEACTMMFSDGVYSYTEYEYDGCYLTEP